MGSGCANPWCIHMFPSDGILAGRYMVKIDYMDGDRIRYLFLLWNKTQQDQAEYAEGIGATAQRHNGTTAQRYVTCKRFYKISSEKTEGARSLRLYLEAIASP